MIHTEHDHSVGEAMQDLASFPLLAAIYGRRSRRFAMGGAIPDGPLAYESKHDPVPLSDLERLIVLTSMAGTTGWHYAITRNARYAPHFANYAGGAAGRTFPSAAGFHTTEFFFTDDSGTYFLPTRDAGALVDRAEEEVTPEPRPPPRRRRASARRPERPWRRSSAGSSCASAGRATAATRCSPRRSRPTAGSA